jgi:hypothetical protein
MHFWLPMLAFEVPFAVWLLTKGVAVPARRVPPHPNPLPGTGEREKPADPIRY